MYYVFFLLNLNELKGNVEYSTIRDTQTSFYTIFNIVISYLAKFQIST